MARNQAAPRGRDRELSALRAGGWREARQGRLVVLRGAAGMGRTTLLAAATRAWRAEGVQVLLAKHDAATDVQDGYGLAELLATLRTHVEYLGTPVSLHRLRELAEDGRPALLPRMTFEVGVLFESLGARGPVALLVDDVSQVPIPVPMLVAARRDGCLVVVTCRSDAEPTPGMAGLLTLADEVIDLEPLPGNEIDAILCRSAGQSLDPACAGALRDALGPLYGNPGTALATLCDLDARDRLVVHRGQLCLRDPAVPIGLPGGHDLLARIERLGPLARRLTAVVAAVRELDVDTIPLLTGVLGADLGTCGRTMDRLVAAGVLVAEGFRVRLVCPALATTVTEPMGGVRAVHTQLAETLLAQGEPTDPLAGAMLGEHLAETDASLPRAAEAVSHLIELAAEVESEDPVRALNYGLVALRYRPLSRRALDRVLTLTVRTGRYDWVYRVDADWCPQRHLPAGAHAGLRMVAELAIVHFGLPLSAAARAWFGLPAQPPADVWWFGDGPLTSDRAAAAEPAKPDAVRSIGGSAGTPDVVGAAEFALVRAALTGDADACRAGFDDRSSGAIDELVEAGRLGDLATVLEIALGDRYRVPDTGPVAAYQRLLRGYANGDWSGALSAAREVELCGGQAARGLVLARLFAAEISAVRGEFTQAEAWLADARPDRASTALHAWVRGGLAWQREDPDVVVELAYAEGWQCGSDGVVSIGLERLLTRGIAAAVSVGDPRATPLLRILVARGRSGTLSADEQSVALCRALVHRERGTAERALDLARGRNRLPELLAACLVLAAATDDPREPLHEAYHLAERFGAPTLRHRILDLIRERGVPRPPAQPGPTPFSPVELRVIAMIRRGYTNRQIASTLRVRQKTAETYLTRLLAKTGTRSRVELIAASMAYPLQDSGRTA